MRGPCGDRSDAVASTCAASPGLSGEGVDDDDDDGVSLSCFVIGLFIKYGHMDQRAMMRVNEHERTRSPTSSQSNAGNPNTEECRCR